MHWKVERLDVCLSTAGSNVTLFTKGTNSVTDTPELTDEAGFALPATQVGALLESILQGKRG